MTNLNLKPFGESIFVSMADVVASTGAVNLGQGFPDWPAPNAVITAAQDAMSRGLNQYPPDRGMAELREAIVAERTARLGDKYDAKSECLVTVGASEAIAATALGLLNPGDHVVIVEPFYDSYPAVVAMAGATHTAVPLFNDGSSWRIDETALADAVTSKTAMIIMNSPHNPTGHIFTDNDLSAVARVATRHDLVVLSDEVYERLVFDGFEHRSIASLPGMRERTVAVASAGKAFNVTGWKIGWAVGPAHLIDGLAAAKQFLTFGCNTPFQPAIAHALSAESGWVSDMAAELQANRDRLVAGLEAAGAVVYPAHAGYFVTADVSAWGLDAEPMVAVAKMAEVAGVVAVPVAAFADHREQFSSLMRFAFCKAPKTVSNAVERLQTAFGE